MSLRRHRPEEVLPTDEVLDHLCDLITHETARGAGKTAMECVFAFYRESHGCKKHISANEILNRIEHQMPKLRTTQSRR
jgi:hypothetical protein